jgi:SAM-dependent methyltransferase
MGKSVFPQADTELSRSGEFFEFFHDPADEIRRLRDKTVLDLGCGYGGRTVGYARKYLAREVIGVEPFPNIISRCKEFADSLGVTNCLFLVNTQSAIPIPSNCVDVALSYDVFEHVDKPVEMLEEVKRVLRPGGRFLLVFTPYLGAFSHHLDYITRLPGLHWVFRPQTLINAVNAILDDSGVERFGTARQPPAHKSFGDKRWCLPGVNGMTGAEFSRLLNGYRVIEMHSTRLLHRFPILGEPGQWLNGLIARAGGSVAEAVSFNLVAVLEKPAMDVASSC